MYAHLTRDVSQDLVSVGQFHAEHAIGEGLHDGAFDFDGLFFVCLFLSRHFNYIFLK